VQEKYGHELFEATGGFPWILRSKNRLHHQWGCGQQINRISLPWQRNPVPAVILPSKPLVIFFTIFVLNSPWPSFSDDHP
jgi:hypothetical protein